MALITLPSKVHFEAVEDLTLTRAGLTIRSRYTGKRQSVNFPFALWRMKGKLLPQRGISAGQWRRFKTQLQGQKNTFKLPVPGTESGPLSGYLAGPGSVSAPASARSLSVQTSGWVSNAVILREGDYFNIGDELKVASEDIRASVGGSATIPFEPFLRRDVAAGVVLNLAAPYVVMAETRDDSGGWGLEHPVDHIIDLDLLEAVE